VHVFGRDGSAEALGRTELIVRKSGKDPERRLFEPVDSVRANLEAFADAVAGRAPYPISPDRKSTRLNSSHVATSYAGLCLKRKRRIARAKDRATFVRQTACDAALVGRR